MIIRVFIVITFIFFIAFSLGCNDTHNEETIHEEWLDTIAVVNEEIITKADFALALYQVKAEMINMEQYANFQKNIQEHLEIMSRYDIEDIAFATVARDTALMSIAKEKDLIPDAGVIKNQVDRAQRLHDEDLTPAIVRTIHEDVGEETFWGEVMYRIEERTIAISNLKSEIYSKHDETRADFFWNDLKRNALLEEEIELIDEEFSINLYQSLRYAEEYFNLTEKYIESNQETIEPGSSQKENIIKPNEETDTISNDDNKIQKEELTDLQFSFYPSGRDFIQKIINERGKVEITDEIREIFNLFARDYRLIYLPDMNYYESFFEANEYAKSFGYNNFGFAVFYVLHYMKCPEKMSDKAMQNAVLNLFVSKNEDTNAVNYKEMPHQAYRKLADYEDGYYSPWPEGGLDHDRMFYLLTGLDIVQEGSHAVYITFHAKSYYFNDTNLYEAGENEKWLAEKSKKLGISELQTAAKLIASGEIEGLKGDKEFNTTIYINYSENNPLGLNPRFVSNESR